MDQLEITKIVGAGCGALLVLLLINFGTESVYHPVESHGDDEHHAMGFEIEVAEEAGGDDEPVEVETVDFAAVYASADAANGEKLFRACGACHKLEAGANAVGPYLHGVVDRPIGSASGYAYSDAMAGHGGEWTPEELSHFIENPKGYIDGTKMNYRGMADVEDRADLIAYLASNN